MTGGDVREGAGLELSCKSQVVCAAVVVIMTE